MLLRSRPACLAIALVAALLRSCSAEYLEGDFISASRRGQFHGVSDEPLGEPPGCRRWLRSLTSALPCPPERSAARSGTTCWGVTAPSSA